MYFAFPVAIPHVKSRNFSSGGSADARSDADVRQSTHYNAVTQDGYTSDTAVDWLWLV